MPRSKAIGAPLLMAFEVRQTGMFSSVARHREEILCVKVSGTDFWVKAKSRLERIQAIEPGA